MPCSCTRGRSAMLREAALPGSHIRNLQFWKTFLDRLRDSFRNSLIELGRCGKNHDRETTRLRRMCRFRCARAGRLRFLLRAQCGDCPLNGLFEPPTVLPEHSPTLTPSVSISGMPSFTFISSSPVKVKSAE